MNLEELKTEWKRYDEKLHVSQRLNEQMILSMLKERSRSRVSKIRRANATYLVLMFLNLVALAAIFIGNPFDFTYALQYVPYGILAIGVLLAILSLVKSMSSFSADINNMSLESFLQRVIAEYDKNKKIEAWFGRIILSAGLLTVFSFLPKKIENKGLWPALGETALAVSITLLVYFIAFKLGAFENRNRTAFENDLKEWNELKQIAGELRE